jgi:hypothetical protein
LVHFLLAVPVRPRPTDAVRSEFRYQIGPFALDQMQILLYGVCRAFE